MSLDGRLGARKAAPTSPRGIRGNLLLVISDCGDVRESPWFFQPDAHKPVFVPAKAEKLIRRRPREYFMVGKKPDGSPVEVRLTAGSFHMEGFF
jgi:hypothetical protein